MLMARRPTGSHTSGRRICLRETREAEKEHAQSLRARVEKCLPWRSRCTEFSDVDEMNLRIKRCCKLLCHADDSRRDIREINRNKNAFHVHSRGYRSLTGLTRVNPPAPKPK